MSLRIATVIASVLIACSDLPPAPVGQLRLGLSSGVGEEVYRLARASFAIEGAAELSLSSEDAPESDTLQRTLPEGDYTVHLLDGWQLERLAAGGAEVVAAELASDNPLPFSILTGELTTVTFQFRTLGDEATSGGDGQVRIAIEVDGAASPHVLISELMKNPEALPDAEGEWIELYNAGHQPLDLAGCTLARDDQVLSLGGALTITAGGHLTLANGDTPGFDPDVVYSGLTLPNAAAFTLSLACGEQLLDRVAVDPAAPTQRPGRSLSLSGSHLDDVSNDAPGSWCEGTDVYDGDYGTPGALNPPCPA